MSDVRTAHDTGAECRCVQNHNPEPQELHRHHILPLADGGPKTPTNEVWLCPTSHVSVHELLRFWHTYEGEPPWRADPQTGFAGRSRFGRYIRGLAQEGYERWQRNRGEA